MSHLTHALSALDAAIPAYLEAQKFYEGNAAEVFTSLSLKKALGTDHDHFSFNYARLVVTSRLDRMEVSSVTSQDGSADSLIDAVNQRNQMDTEILDALEASLVYGDSYLIVGEDVDGVDVFYNDPLSTRVFYNAENPRKKDYAIKRWLSGDRLRVNLYFEDRIEKYISKSEPHTNMLDNDFEPFFEAGQDVWPLVNESGSIPVFHLRTGRMYGTPEHKQAYGPQRALSKLINTQISSIEFSTAPQRYFLEDPSANDGVNPAADFGGSLVDDDDDDQISKLKAGPGGIWNLKGIKSVGEFSAADPSVFVVPFKTYIESMSTVTKTPMHAFNVGALPSGESLRAAEAPLNKRVVSLESGFGAVLEDLYEYALSLLGVQTKVTVQWDAPATYDDGDVWSVVKAKTDAGVPLTAALMEAGYTAEQVNEWYPEGEVQHRTASEIDQLADAIQKLSAAVSLGVISPEEARNLIPQDILTAFVPTTVDSAVAAATAVVGG